MELKDIINTQREAPYNYHESFKKLSEIREKGLLEEFTALGFQEAADLAEKNRFREAQNILYLLRKINDSELKDKADIFIGRISIKQENYRQAHRALFSIIERNTVNIDLVDGDVYYYMALCCFRLHNFHEAEEFCLKALKRGALRQNVYLLQFEIYSNLLVWKCAEKYSFALLLLDKDERAYEKRLELIWSNFQYGIMTLQPYIERLLYLGQMRDWETMQVEAKKILFLEPGNHEVVGFLIEANNQLGCEELNISIIRNALFNNPFSEQLLNLLFLNTTGEEKNYIHKKTMLLNKLRGTANEHCNNC